MKLLTLFIGLLIMSMVFFAACQTQQPASSDNGKITSQINGGNPAQPPAGSSSADLDQVAENEVDIGEMV